MRVVPFAVRPVLHYSILFLCWACSRGCRCGKIDRKITIQEWQRNGTQRRYRQQTPDQSVQLVLKQNLVTLLPFALILKGGDAVDVVSKAITLLRADQNMAELEPLLAFFASFVLQTDVVRRILRWDMSVLRESPWYAQILKLSEPTGPVKISLAPAEKHGIGTRSSQLR
jgi:hypothetical protein